MKRKIYGKNINNHQNYTQISEHYMHASKK